MNKVKIRLLILSLLLPIGMAVNAQTKLNPSNSGNIYSSCSGYYSDDGGSSIYSDSYDTNNDGTPDYLCWTFCPSHPINEGVRITFAEWDLHPSDEFRIRDGNLGVCSHVYSNSYSPIIGTFTGHSVSQFDGSAGGTYAYGGGGWIESSPTNTSGCLTVEFKPDGDGNKGTGWRFNVECLQEEVSPSKVFISEYYNNCNGDMYVELFNPTNEKVYLDSLQFSLRRQSGTTFGNAANAYNLSGHINPYSSYLVCKSGINSQVRPDCDATISSFGNGSWFSKIKCKEALGLFQKGFVIDQIGDETTSAVREGATSRSLAGITVAGISDAITNNTLIRKKEVVCGSVDWDASSGTTEANSQWLLIPDGRFNNAGMHVFGNPKIFISEYYGSNTADAYVEVYNGTGGNYNLDGLELILAEGSQDWAGTAPAGTPSYSGGWTQAGANSKILPLSGTLGKEEVHVICNLTANPALACQADLLLDLSASNGQSTLSLADGNDAIGLFLNHVLIDVVGYPGRNTPHTVGRVSSATKHRVLVRGSGVKESNCDWSDSSSGSWPDWDLLNSGDFSHVGAHKKTPTKCFEQVIFTEIVNTKKKVAIGIMNKSTTSLNLSEIKIKMATSGNGWESDAIEFPRGISLAPNTEYVVYQTVDEAFDNIPSHQKMLTNKLFLSDGVTRHLDLDDALAIVKEEDGSILDVFGDPNRQNNGVGYKIGGVNNALAYNVVRRRSSIVAGNTKPMESFGTTRLNSEWFLVNNTNLEGFGEANINDVVPGIEYRVETVGNADCGGSDGTIQISATGGSAPLRIFVNDQQAIDGILTGLTTGRHSLNIRDVYGVNHRTTFDYTAPTGTSFEATVETIQTPSCFRDPDGIAQVISEESQLSYKWSNGVTTATNNQLSTGFHTVTITNATGCEQIVNFEVEESPAITAMLSGVPSVCSEASGSVSTSVSGGTGEYSYLWSTGNISDKISNVPNGRYTVTITDNNECTVVSSIGLIGPLGLSVATNLVQPTCQNNGSIELQVNGGSAPYQYNWNNTGFVEEVAVISNLVAGQYVVTIKDANGCEIEEQFIIQNESISNTRIEAAQDASCNGTKGFAVIVGIEEGMQFLWEDGSTATFNTNLSAGIHQVTVTTAQNCSNTLQVEIKESSSLEVAITKDTPINCSNGFGQITAHASGGQGVYQYRWNTGHSYHSIIIAEEGDYSVTITDESGCSEIQSLIVESDCNIKEDKPAGTSRSATVMDPFVLSQITFYPNPTKGLLTIADRNADFEEMQIQVYSAQGQLVKEMIVLDRQEQIDLTDFSNGLYVVKITRDQSIGFQKIVLER